MITAIRAELLKIRTTPLAAALLALAAGLNGLVAAVTAGTSRQIVNQTLAAIE